MKMCYLDANFIIYLLNKDMPQNSLATSKLTTLIKNRIELYISPLTIDEFIHSMISIKREKSLSEKIDLRQDLKLLLDLPRLSLINPPQDKNSQFLVLEYMQKYILRPRDAYHLLTMLSNSVDTFATFDSDFKRVFSAKMLSQL